MTTSIKSMTLEEYMSVEDPYKPKKPVLKKNGEYWKEKNRQKKARKERRKSKGRKKKSSPLFGYHDLWSSRGKRKVPAKAVDKFVAEHRGDPKPKVEQEKDPLAFFVNFEIMPQKRAGDNKLEMYVRNLEGIAKSSRYKDDPAMAEWVKLETEYWKRFLRRTAEYPVDHVPLKEAAAERRKEEEANWQYLLKKQAWLKAHGAS